MKDAERRDRCTGIKSSSGVGCSSALRRTGGIGSRLYLLLLLCDSVSAFVSYSGAWRTGGSRYRDAGADHLTGRALAAGQRRPRNVCWIGSGAQTRSRLSLRSGPNSRRRGLSTDDEFINLDLINQEKQESTVPQGLPGAGTDGKVPCSTLTGETSWGRYSGRSMKGYKGEGYGTMNQDSMIACAVGEMDLFGVFDGHGEDGTAVSSYIAEKLPGLLREQESEIFAAGDDEEQLFVPLNKAFTGTHESLDDVEDVDGLMSGSTCVTVLVVGSDEDRRLIIANAGDCRVTIATKGFGGKMITSQLSYDHSPDRPDERARIEGLDGVVGMVDLSLDPPKVISPEKTAKQEKDLGPVRVFFRDGVWMEPFDTCFPGLAMSRSLGDKILDELGVFPEPEVTVRKLKPKDQFMVIASDGVWQVLSNEEVTATVIESAGDSAAACKAIDDLAAERWAQMNDAPYRDDITTLVVYFN